MVDVDAESSVEDDADGGLSDKQYRTWGLAVKTSRVLPVHIANGLVQLLRLASSPPPWDVSRPNFVGTYVRAVKNCFGQWPSLPDAAKGLCVTETRKGPLLLAAESAQDKDAPFIHAARSHFTQRLGAVPLPDEQRLLKSVLNADGKVMVTGGDDPTTPGLCFAGFSRTHTLRGMHAATFLGLLCRTSLGRSALVHLYRLLADTADGHSELIAALGLAQEGCVADRPSGWPKALSVNGLESAYPLPDDPRWLHVAETTGAMASSLLAWNEQGASKADTLMAMTDLCALQLTMQLLHWSPQGTSTRLILLLSPREMTQDLRNAEARARQSLGTAAAALNSNARAAELIATIGRKKDQAVMPSVHAMNLGAAGGWLHPHHSEGGAKRYLRPGPRQMVTLVRSLLHPNEGEISWRELEERAQRVGIALGGWNEHTTAARLQIGSASDSVRRAGAANQEHIVALGLARRESDNVVIVDGGAS